MVWSVYPSALHHLTETQRRADNMTITLAEASHTAIINQLPPETIAQYEAWLDGHIDVDDPKGDIAVGDNIVYGND